MPAEAWTTVLSPAKINLFLEVLGKRDDGYHELVTVMACISLADRIAFRAVTGEITGEVTGLASDSLPPWKQNLVFRALELLRSESGTQMGMQVRLEKRIPQQAGLGGGSSNAATALRVANRLWGLHWSADRLAELAARLGSDVPFFLSSGTAICRGRGERVRSIPGLPGVPVLIAQPPEGLSTPLVFAGLDGFALRRSGQETEAALQRRDPLALGTVLFNRLEQPASRLSVWPDRMRNEFDRLPCLGHQMSGSGSCWFGLFSNHLVARRCQRLLEQRLPEVRVSHCQLMDGGESLAGD